MRRIHFIFFTVAALTLARSLWNRERSATNCEEESVNALRRSSDVDCSLPRGNAGTQKSAKTAEGKVSAD